MDNDLGQFLFLAAGSVALFAYLSVVHWVNTGAAERQTRDRYGVLRKVAEQPTESAQLVLQLLREEDARAQKKEREQQLQARRNGMLGGTLMIAVGLGLMIMFAFISRRTWAIGLVPMFSGIVVLVFAAFGKPADTGQ
jgi:hypothetical protein